MTIFIAADSPRCCLSVVAIGHGRVHANEGSASGELGLLPSPLWGRGGEGVARRIMIAPPEKHRTTPTPNPSPQGGGEHTECVALGGGHKSRGPPAHQQTNKYQSAR